MHTQRSRNIILAFIATLVLILIPGITTQTNLVSGGDVAGASTGDEGGDDTDTPTPQVLGAFDETSQIGVNAANLVDQQAFVVTVGDTNDADFVIDGVDDQEQIQLALNEVESQGGGAVILNGAEYEITSTIILPSNTSLVGIEKHAVVLKIPDGATNFDVIRSENFSSLTQTGSELGITKSRVSTLTIDGNSSNITASGNVNDYDKPALVKIFGYFNELDNLILKNAKEVGIYNEWARVDGSYFPTKNDDWNNLEIVDYGYVGIIYRGPSNSIWNQVLVGSTQSPLHHVLIESRDTGGVAYDGSGVLLENLHMFGNATDHALKVQGDGTIKPTLLGTIIEGGTSGVNSASVYLNADGSKLSILPYFADIGIIVAGNNNTIDIGNVLEGVGEGIDETLVQIGDSANGIAASGNLINVHAKNVKNAVNFDSSNGSNIINGQHYYSLTEFPNGQTIGGTYDITDKSFIWSSSYDAAAARPELVTINPEFTPIETRGAYYIDDLQAFQLGKSSTDFNLNYNSQNGKFDFVNNSTLDFWSNVGGNNYGALFSQINGVNKSISYTNGATVSFYSGDFAAKTVEISAESGSITAQSLNITNTITQNSHGFNDGDIIYLDTDGLYKLSNPLDSTTHDKFLFSVGYVLDLNTFVVVSNSGRVYRPAHGISTPGTILYLSNFENGKITLDKPSTGGHAIIKIGQILDDDHIYFDTSPEIEIVP